MKSSLICLLLLGVESTASLAANPKPFLSDNMGQITCITFCGPDGLVTGSESGEITIWSLLRLKKKSVHKLTQGQPLHQVTVIEEGRAIVASSLEELVVFSLSEERKVFASRIKEQINGFAVYPRAQRVAVLCADEKVRIIDLKTQKEVSCLLSGERTHNFTQDGLPQPISVSVSSDEKLIAVGYGRVFLDGCHHVHVWDAKTWKHLHKHRAGVDVTKGVGDFHPTRPTTLAVTGSNDCADVWDLGQEKRVAFRELPRGSWVDELRYSPNGRFLGLTASDGSAFLIEETKADLLLKTNSARSILKPPAFSQDGKLIALLLKDYTEKEKPVANVYVFDTATRKPLSR
jgi:WD40 repeat protein